MNDNTTKVTDDANWYTVRRMIEYHRDMRLAGNQPIIPPVSFPEGHDGLAI